MNAVIDARFAGEGAANRDPRGLLAAVLVGLALIFGGGGSTAPLSELVLEAIAAAMLVAWVWLGGAQWQWPMPKSLWLLVTILVAIPLVQLVPLPPFLWHNLPGHETERAALALIGQDGTWRPWTVAPSRTFAGLLSLGPCILVMLMAADLARTGRSQAMAMVAAIGVIALLVGAAQVAGGDDGPFRFYGLRTGNIEGFQANRNHAADMLLIAMVAFAAATREWQLRWRPGQTGLALPAIVLGAGALFSIAVIVTTSRAGVALLPVAWLALVLLIRPWLRFDQRSLGALALIGLVAVLIGAWFVHHNHVIARIAARFTLDQEFRPRIWEDSLYAARLYFPFGSGVGTFVPVFQAIERLENVDTFLTNRAHNDYLELAIEGGLAAIAAFLACAAIVIRSALASLRRPPAGSMPQVIFALATLTVIALHSLVDYPLRSMSLQCLAGLAVALLMTRADSHRQGPGMPLETASMKDDL